MVCDGCQIKLSNLAVPDKWRDNGAMANSRGNSTVGHTNKALAAMKASASWMPSETKCKLCKSKVQHQMSYCNNCAFKKGICAMCGAGAVDVSMYKSSNFGNHKVEKVEKIVDVSGAGGEKAVSCDISGNSSSSSSSNNNNHSSSSNIINSNDSNSSNKRLLDQGGTDETVNNISSSSKMRKTAAELSVTVQAVLPVFVSPSALWPTTSTTTTRTAATTTTSSSTSDLIALSTTTKTSLKKVYKPTILKSSIGLGLDINVNKLPDGSPSPRGGAIVIKLKEMSGDGLQNPATKCDPPVLPGDVIIGVNGVSLTVYSEILSALRSCAVGTSVELWIEREVVIV